MIATAVVEGNATSNPPLIEVVSGGSPVDDACAWVAAGMNRLSLDMAAERVMAAKRLEDMIFDGVVAAPGNGEES